MSVSCPLEEVALVVRGKLVASCENCLSYFVHFTSTLRSGADKLQLRSKLFAQVSAPQHFLALANFKVMAQRLAIRALCGGFDMCS